MKYRGRDPLPRLTAFIAALSWCLLLAGCSYLGPWIPFPVEGSTISSTNYSRDTIQLEVGSVSVKVHGSWLNDSADFYVTVSNNWGTKKRIDLARTKLTTWFLLDDELVQPEDSISWGVKVDGTYFAGPAAHPNRMEEMVEEYGSVEAYLETLPAIPPDLGQRVEIYFFTEKNLRHCLMAVLTLVLTGDEGEIVFELPFTAVVDADRV